MSLLRVRVLLEQIQLIDQLLRQTLAGEIWASLSNACLTHVKLGMPSLPVGGVYAHPDATSSMIPHLKAHLLHASTELYVVQVPPAPDSTVFATFPRRISAQVERLGCWSPWNHWNARERALVLVFGGRSARNRRGRRQKNAFVRRMPNLNRCLGPSVTYILKETLLVRFTSLQNRVLVTVYPHLLQRPPESRMERIGFLQRLSSSAGFSRTGYWIKVHFQKDGHGGFE